jgi:hypothetical protein
MKPVPPSEVLITSMHPRVVCAHQDGGRYALRHEEASGGDNAERFPASRTLH